MTGKKSRPRSIKDYLDANWLFDADAAAEVIAAVGGQPKLDADNIPDHLKDCADTRIVELSLAWHLNELSKHYRFAERRQNLPSPKNVAKRAGRIADLCQLLADEMMDSEGQIIDGIGTGYLFAFAAKDGEESGAAKIRVIGEDILSLKKWAEESAALATMKDTLKPRRRGAPRDVAFHDFLNRLSGIYYWYWRSRPGRSVDPYTGIEGGPYFRFARAVVAKVLPEWGAENRNIDGALGAAIAEHGWPQGLWE